MGNIIIKLYCYMSRYSIFHNIKAYMISTQNIPLFLIQHTEAQMANNVQTTFWDAFLVNGIHNILLNMF